MQMVGTQEREEAGMTESRLDKRVREIENVRTKEDAERMCVGYLTGGITKECTPDDIRRGVTHALAMLWLSGFRWPCGCRPGLRVVTCTDPLFVELRLVHDSETVH